MMLLFSFNALYVTEVIFAPIIIVSSYVCILVAIYTFGVLLMYKRIIKKVKPRYPLAYPGEPDEYLPGFSIPRPIIEDVREHPEYFEKKEEK
jgi:hypothetical protein